MQALPQSIAVPQLAVSERYAGMVISKTAEASYHLILIAGGIDKLKWAEASEWADSVGGSLPTRREQALLFANLPEEFRRDWYWSAERHADNAGWAWCQGFDCGYQGYGDTDDRLRARAVRRLPIQSFDHSPASETEVAA